MIHLNQAVGLGLSTKEPQHYMQSMHSLQRESAKQPAHRRSRLAMVHIANENDDTIKQLQYTSNKCMCAFLHELPYELKLIVMSCSMGLMKM